MANYATLKAAINAVIKANGNKEITGTVLNEVLLAMVNSLGAGYQFAGVATPDTNPGTPDQKVFYIASQAGTYTNFNGAVVSDGIAIFEWNGTWTTEMLDLSMAGQVQSDWTETDTTKKSYIKHKPNIPPSANVDPVPTEDSPNAVSSGGTYDMIVSTAATLFGDIQNATDINATLSEDGKIYNDYNAGDIFYIEQDDVRKYRVAYAAGTADAEHPVTINGTLFYFADNASDAIYLSLRIKTVSTEQQSLSAQQKAQARTNIAAVSYDQQSLNADQQIQAQNNVFGKAYSSTDSDHSGLGKVYVDKNNGVLTQAMVNTANTVYVIQYDYTMNGNITVPAGCTLEFDGGSIKDGTLTGQNTCILGKDKPIFENIHIAGSWNVPNIYSIWFSDITTNNVLKELFNLSSDTIYNNIYIAQGTYNVSTPTREERFCLQVKSNTKLEIDGTIQLAANNQISYNIININNKENVVVCGSGTIIGDKNTHTGTEGEWGHGIGITEGCENIEVYGLTVKDCWGDCIAVDGNSVNKNINIHDFVLDNGRRQGISVIFADNVKISNGVITNISGTEPYAAIDIEPNVNGYCKNIYVNNVKAVSERGFILAQGNAVASSTDVENVCFENCYVEATEFAIDIRCGNKTQFTNCTFKQNNTEKRYAIIAQSGSKGVTFDNCSIETNTTYAFHIASISDDAIIQNCICTCNEFVFTQKHIVLDGNYITCSGNFGYLEGLCNINNNLINCLNIRLDGVRHIFSNNNIIATQSFTSQYSVVKNNTINSNAVSIVTEGNIEKNQIQCDTFSTSGGIYLTANKILAGYISFKLSNVYNNTFINSKDTTFDAFIYIQNTRFKNNSLNCSRESGTTPRVYVISQTSPSVCEENVFISNPLIPGVYYTSQDGNVFKNNTYDDTMTVGLPTNSSIGFKDNNIGTTRPTLVASKAGFCFFDKNLNPARPIWWNGTAWIDATGATV